MKKVRFQLLAVAVLTLATLVAVAAPAVAACQKTSLAEIDDEVMCPICGTPLGAAGGPQAEDEREFIRGLVEKCQSKAQIKTALVAEYGEEVLALPKGKGFNLTIYVVPAAAMLLAAALIALAARRWRRERGGLDIASSPAPEGDSDRRSRLDADMSKYDL